MEYQSALLHFSKEPNATLHLSRREEHGKKKQITDLIKNGYGIERKQLVSPLRLRNPWYRRQDLLAMDWASLFKSWRIWKDSFISKSFIIIPILYRILFKAKLLKLSAEFKAFISNSESPKIWMDLKPFSLASWTAKRRL